MSKEKGILQNKSIFEINSLILGENKNFVRTHLHLPLEVVSRIMSSSTYNFNEFKTYLSFAFRTSGNCKLDFKIKNQVCNHLGISQRTLKKHIQTLILKGYFGYNPKTNTLFINGLNKIKRLVYLQYDCNEEFLKCKTSFRLNVSDIENLRFLIFSAKEQYILRFQLKYKNNLKFEEYLISQGLIKRYKNGNESVKRQLKRLYNLEKRAKGDSMKKENPNHFGTNLFVDDKDYLGVSNSFISDNFNRTKSWGSKMKKKSSILELLKYNKKVRYVNSYPITFNVRRYLSITCPTTYHKLFCVRKDDNILVFERGYDEIISNVKLTRRK